MGIQIKGGNGVQWFIIVGTVSLFLALIGFVIAPLQTQVERNEANIRDAINSIGSRLNDHIVLPGHITSLEYHARTNEQAQGLRLRLDTFEINFSEALLWRLRNAETDATQDERLRALERDMGYVWSSGKWKDQ